MNASSLKTLLFACLTIFMTACTVSNNTSELVQNSVTPLQSEYYKALPNNLSRLVALREGFFVLKAYRQSDSMLLDYTMPTGDSILLYTKQFGIPNRDGFWVAQVQFMSSIPDQPLVRIMEEFEQISRDTFKGTQWVILNELTFRKISDPEFASTYEFDVDEFKEISRILTTNTYVRKRSDQFIAISSRFPPVNKELQQTYQFRQDMWDYEPLGSTLHRTYIIDDNSPVQYQDGDSLNFFQRLHPETLKAYRAAFFEEEE